jgi:hypothetical protein
MKTFLRKYDDKGKLLNPEQEWIFDPNSVHSCKKDGIGGFAEIRYKNGQSDTFYYSDCEIVWSAYQAYLQHLFGS